MKMSSLVAYEESESEDDSLDQTAEGAPASVHTGSCKPNREIRVCNSSEVTPSPHVFSRDPGRSVVEHHGNVTERSRSSLVPHSQPERDWERKYCIGETTQEQNIRDTAAPLSSCATQGKISPLQTLRHMPQSSGDGLNTTKRHQTAPSGVRPYIPKRQRVTTSVETVDPKCVAEQVPGNQTREIQIFSEVSAKVKPYLAHSPSAAGIPRRLLRSLGGHQGPVNTVQWCPVPHLSHLLLSASMDKTFKVMIATKKDLTSEMMHIDT